MHRVAVIGSVVVAAGALLGPATPASAASDVFRGTWTSIDPGDQSFQTLSIQGSGTAGKHSLFLYDTVASAACHGEPASVIGAGTVEDDTLTWFFTVTCPGSGRPPLRGLVGPGFFMYHAGSDTLTDDAGAVWHRT